MANNRYILSFANFWNPFHSGRIYRILTDRERIPRFEMVHLMRNRWANFSPATSYVTQLTDNSKITISVSSWFISPICSGIVSVVVYVFIKKYILYSENPVRNGLQSLPIFYGVTIGINVFSVIEDGSKSKYWYIFNRNRSTYANNSRVQSNLFFLRFLLFFIVYSRINFKRNLIK